MTETTKDSREGWTKEECERYDARADHEQWAFTASILEPWVEAARAIGHPELTQVMEEALAVVEGEVNRTLGALEAVRGSEVSA